MSAVTAIAKKELLAYFRSPIAYIIIIVMIAIFNIFFFIIADDNRETSLQQVFQAMEFMFVFLLPILTMKLLAEEKSAGTMEFLMTAPISNGAIVLGKYLGILALFSVLVVTTLVYYAIVEYFGNPDRITLLSGYVGIWLEGAFFIAVGLLASSWTRHQIVAAMTSYLIIFLLYFSHSIAPYFSGTAQSLILYLSTRTHLDHFVAGMITAGDVVYYLSGIVVCLILTRLSLENRLWH